MNAGDTWRRMLHVLQRTKFYWQRLRGERLTKALGIGVTVFALVMQSFALIQPAQTAQAAVSDPNDNIIYQGAANKAQLLAIYDSGRDSAGHTDIKQIYSTIGITRDDLSNAAEGTYYTDDFSGQINTLGRMDWKTANRSQLSVSGASTTIFTGDFLDGYNAKHYPMHALIGKRAVDNQWFAITLDCGNVVYVTLPPKPVKNITVCRPGTGIITIKETERQAGDVESTSSLCQPAVFKCDALRVTQITRTVGGELTSSSFTTETTATNAKLTSITYVVRDSSGQEISRSTNASYHQTQPGTYTVQAIPTFDVKGQTQTVTDDDCTATLMVPAENQVTVCRPGTGVITIKESEKRATDLPAGDQACQPKPEAQLTVCRPGSGVVTIVESQKLATDLAADDQACQPKPVTPVRVELPKTGTDDVVVSALGLGLLSAASYFYWDSRRLLGRS